jgi:hypothetical protein
MHRLPGKYWCLSNSVPLIAVMLWAVAGQLEASILTPDQVTSDIEQLVDDVAPDTLFSNPPWGAGGQAVVPFDGEDHDSGQPSEIVFITLPTFPGDATSGSSTSTGGIGGTGAFPLASAATVSVTDAELMNWIGGEQRFRLPTPPGNELFRPPRVIA